MGSLSCCGARQGLRLTKQACPLPTAATRSAHFFCHRQRSHLSPPGSGNCGYQNIINANIKQCRKNNQIINCGKSCSILPLVDGLRRIEAKTIWMSATVRPAAFRRFTILAPVCARSMVGMFISYTSCSELFDRKWTQKAACVVKDIPLQIIL